MSLGRDYFEQLYAADDPWGFRSRWYEARKRALTLAALLAPRYRAIFEPGCSIGVLTADLAARGDRVLAMDVSERALERARDLRLGNLELRQGAMPGDWPSGDFGLVVLSELGYYLDEADCGRLGYLAAGCTDELVAVHWRHPVADYPLTGDRVHELLADAAAAAGLARVAQHVEVDLRLDSWSRDPRSLAERSGLVS